MWWRQSKTSSLDVGHRIPTTDRHLTVNCVHLYLCSRLNCCSRRCKTEFVTWSYYLVFYKSLFNEKLFNTNNTKTVKACHKYYSLELPGIFGCQNVMKYLKQNLWSIKGPYIVFQLLCLVYLVSNVYFIIYLSVFTVFLLSLVVLILQGEIQIFILHSVLRLYELRLRHTT